MRAPAAFAFVPVYPGEAIGDLAGIPEVSDHQFLDLALVAAGLAGGDNEILNMERSSP